MNVLNVYPDPEGLGGSERSMHLGAQAVRDAGHRIFMLHGSSEWERSEHGYDGTLNLPDLFGRGFLPPQEVSALVERVREFIARERIDVLHVQRWPRVSSLIPLAQSCPTVVTAHVAPCPNKSRYLWDERAVCDRTAGLGCLTVGYMKCGCGRLGNGKPYSIPAFVRSMGENHLHHKFFLKCARVIAPSRWMKERLVQDGVPASVLRVLPPPISGLDASAPDAPAAEMPEAPVVLYVGRLVDYKGPDQLISASAQIKQPHQIWIIGDGSAREGLERLAASHGIADRVTFLGAMQPEEIDHYRRLSAVIAVPSLWPEVFGMVGPEAFLARKPVVAYNVGGISEWLTDGETGRLVPAKDVAAFAAALSELLADPALARRMGDAAHAKVSQWIPAAHGARLAQIYREAIAARTPGAVPEPGEASAQVPEPVR